MAQDSNSIATINVHQFIDNKVITFGDIKALIDALNLDGRISTVSYRNQTLYPLYFTLTFNSSKLGTYSNATFDYVHPSPDWGMAYITPFSNIKGMNKLKVYHFGDVSSCVVSISSKTYADFIDQTTIAYEANKIEMNLLQQITEPISIALTFS